MVRFPKPNSHASVLRRARPLQVASAVLILLLVWHWLAPWETLSIGESAPSLVLQSETRSKNQNGGQKYQLRDRLATQANEQGYILMTAINYDYRHMLSNLHCNLQRLQQSSQHHHLVVAALDDDVYEWGIRQGLPVFSATESLQMTGDNSLAYGSDEFKALTKLKSRVVLEALQAGYSVVWTDVDITWFELPFQALAPYLRNTTGVAIQSNAPYVANPAKEALPHVSVSPVKMDNATGYRRLNSGLYVAPSSPLVRQAFSEIVAHARASSMSEQPSFDYVLCEREPSQRFRSHCLYGPTGSQQQHLPVQTMDRLQFPNGAVLVGENNANIYTLGRKAFEEATQRKVSLAHNNWIAGKDAKMQRQVDRGWWFLDQDGTCTVLGGVE